MWGIAVGKGQTSYWQTQQLGMPLNPAIADPTPVMTDAARRLGMEVFASIRMNDTHDAFGKPHGRLDYPLKLEHPEWLLGDESRRGDFHAAPGSTDVVGPRLRGAAGARGPAPVDPGAPPRGTTSAAST